MKTAALVALWVMISAVSWQHASAQDSASAPAATASSPAASETTASATAAATNVTTTGYTLPPDKLRKAKALYLLEGKMRVIDTVYSFAILLGLLYFGIAARYRGLAESVSGRRFIQALIVVPLLLLTMDLLGLPLDAYQHHVSLQYGLSVQRWGSWLADFGKGEAISIVFSIVMLWILISVVRKSPRRWWFYFWLAAMPILVFMVFIAPVVIDPMFNKFQPLDAKHPELVSAIESVVQRGGLAIPRERMYEMRASEKVTTLNAYVTGFGASKRVVVWDTTIQKLTTPETLFVFGHEMGHYVLHHILHGMVVGAVALLVAMYVLYLVAGWVLRHVPPRWAIRELGDWAALPLIFLLFGIFGFVAQPLLNGYSRNVEHEADIYGLEVTHGINANSRQAATHAFQVLGELSLDYPRPSRFVVFWFYNHPAIADRVRFAAEYDPWETGKPTRYVK